MSLCHFLSPPSDAFLFLERIYQSLLPSASSLPHAPRSAGTDHLSRLRTEQELADADVNWINDRYRALKACFDKSPQVVFLMCLVIATKVRDGGRTDAEEDGCEADANDMHTHTDVCIVMLTRRSCACLLCQLWDDRPHSLRSFLRVLVPTITKSEVDQRQTAASTRGGVIGQTNT